MDFKKAIEAVINAGSLIEDKSFRNTAIKKGDKDFVTECDYAIQKQILEALSCHYPDVPVIAEEKDNNGLYSDLVFILDPLDGTTNFMHGYEPSCISLGCVHHNEPVFGIVYDPVRKKTYIGKKDKGAVLNNEPIKVSKTDRLEQALIACETSPYEREMTDMHFEKLKKIFIASMDIRISGSAALDICHVAEGKADAFLTRNLKPWDYAASICILNEAGGICTDWEGFPPSFPKKSDILASNGLLQEVLYAYIRRL